MIFILFFWNGCWKYEVQVYDKTITRTKDRALRFNFKFKRFNFYCFMIIKSVEKKNGMKYRNNGIMLRIKCTL